MKKKLLTIIGSICLVLVLAALLIPGCAKEAPVTPAPVTPAPVTPAPVTPTPVTPTPVTPTPVTPAPAAEVFEWAFQHCMTGTDPMYYYHVDMCDRIEAISGGRLKIKVHPCGEIADPYKGPDCVKTGVVDVSIQSPSPLVGSVGQVAQLPSSGMPAGPSGPDNIAWYYQKDGAKKLSQEIWEGWCQVIGIQSSTPELFCHSNIKIETTEDIKGLRFRTFGLWGDFMKEYGASVITLAGAEIYPAAERGVVDAFEYCGAATNWPMGFHEITKYLGIPGIHSPTACRFVIVNYDVWDKLPDDLKLLVTDEIERAAYDYYVLESYLDAEALEKYAEYGTETVVVSDELQQEIARWSKAWCEKQMGDPLFKEVFESMRDFLRTYKAASTLIAKYSIFD